MYEQKESYEDFQCVGLFIMVSFLDNVLVIPHTIEELSQKSCVIYVGSYIVRVLLGMWGARNNMNVWFGRFFIKVLMSLGGVFFFHFHFNNNNINPWEVCNISLDEPYDFRGEVLEWGCRKLAMWCVWFWSNLSHSHWSLVRGMVVM